jgi:DNA-binding response OmpR family regulator
VVSTHPGPPRILVVEDDLDERLALCAALEMRGFRAIPAADGREALELILDLEPAAVVLDLMLPRMDGRQLLTVLASYSRLSRIPVIVVSGTDARGVDAHRLFPKPVDVDELVRCLAECARLRTANG